MTSSAVTSGLISWRPMVAAYDTFRLGGVPEAAYGRETLALVDDARANRSFVTWDAYMDLLDATHAWCGSDERLIEVASGFDRAVPEVTALAHSTADTRAFLNLVINSYDAASFPELEMRAEMLADDRIEIVVRTPASYRAGRAWFVANLGAIQSIPVHLGLPRAHVSGDVGTHSGRYRVEFAAGPAQVIEPTVSSVEAVAMLTEILRDDVRRAVSLPGRTRTADQRVNDMGDAWGLTAQERKVLALVCRGLSNKEIANEFGCAVRTVEIHITHVLKKSGLESRAQLQASVAALG